MLESELFKVVWILVFMSPVLFTCLLLGVLFTRGFNYLAKYPLFWLVAMIITGLMAIVAFFSIDTTGFKAIMALIAFNNSCQSYRLLMEKSQRRKKN